MSRFACGGALLPAAMALAGCTTYHTIELKPIATARAQLFAEDSNIDAPYCHNADQIHVHLPALLDLALAPFEVGGLHHYDPGSGLAPCWDWVSAVDRGFARFDLTPVVGKKIATAKLSWGAMTSRFANGTAQNFPTCLKSLREPKGAWAWSVPYDLVTDELDQPALEGGVFVTELVAKWAKAGGGERSIYFAAADEQTHAKTNARCTTLVYGLGLAVTYGD
jgi:hypothetical protein